MRNKIKSGFATKEIKYKLSKQGYAKGGYFETGEEWVFVDDFDKDIALFMLNEEGLLNKHISLAMRIASGGEYSIEIKNDKDTRDWIEREFPYRNINYRFRYAKGDRLDRTDRESLNTLKRNS